MKVFISYGSATDQVTALRLQALAAVNGLQVYVPPVQTRQFDVSLIPAESAKMLGESNVVLGVIGTGLSGACREELNSSLASGKPTMVMTSPVFASQLQAIFGANLVVVDPASPETAEYEIVARLKAMDVEQNTRTALLALGTLALGLLIFMPRE